MSHTPEPWHWVSDGHEIDILTFKSPGYYGNPELYSVSGQPVLTCGEYDITNNREDAIRLIACVNGCAGLNPAAYREVVEALKLAIQEVQEAGGNRSIDLDGQWLSSAIAALAHAEAPHA